MLINLIDLVPYVDVDAGIGILLLNNAESNLQRVTWGDHDLVCEETVEEPLIENGRRDLYAAPEKLPAAFASLEDGSGNLYMSNLDYLPGRFVN